MNMQNDHDLLIRLDANVTNLTIEVKALRDNTIARINSIENMKLDRDIFEEYRLEIEKIMTEIKKKLDETTKKSERLSAYVYIGIGIILTVQTLISLFK